MAGDPDRFRVCFDRARSGDRYAVGELLEVRRDRLVRLAEGQLTGRVTQRLDALDAVQQTFLEAYRSFADFRGATAEEFAGWLDQILANNVAGILRDNSRLKRSVRREKSLDQPAASGAVLSGLIPSPHTTPSQRAMRGEDAARLGRALATLPPDQREAVRLRHLEGWSLAAIADHLGRSLPAAAGLIKRGMQALRENLAAGNGRAE